MIKFFLILILINSSISGYTLPWEESVQVEDTIFSEHFENMNNWTIVGPMGFNNWFVQNTNLAGGNAAPELAFRWDPVFIGDSYILSPVINGAGNRFLEMIFTYSIDWWSNTMTVGVAITSDGGSSYTSIWEYGATTSYPPVTDTINFTGVENMQIALYYTGDSNDADFWYIDDLYLIDLNPVPVELTSFSANANKNDVELNWSTATELNNKGFELQRRSEDRDFNKIAFINGHGTTTETHTYSFKDENPGEGIFFYRLKQIDLSGTFDYSDEVMVTISNPVSFELEQNYPNPFNPSTTIKFTISPASTKLYAGGDLQFTNLKVYDVLGKEVATLVNEESAIGGAGSYKVEFNAAGLPSGIYFYKLQTDVFIATKKMILMK
jgi:hypothetical protein